MQVGYIDDSYIMRAHIAKEGDNASRCSILCKYEIACITGDRMHKEIPKKGKLMSLMAVNDDTQDLLDLRPYLTEAEDKWILDWTVPDGNWNMEQYFCEKDTEANYIDYLDYDISSNYLKATLIGWRKDMKCFRPCSSTGMWYMAAGTDGCGMKNSILFLKNIMDSIRHRITLSCSGISGGIPNGTRVCLWFAGRICLWKGI